MNYRIRLSNFLAVSILTAIVLMTGLHIASQKFFWYDEAFEIFELCQTSGLEIFLGQTSQASKNPLYYLFQKIVVDHVQEYNEKILIFFRLISLFSATGLMVITFLYLRSRLNGRWAIIGFMALTGQSLYFHFAAENRPYMFWLLLSLLFLLITVRICSTRWDDVNRKDKIIFVVLSCALVLTIAISIFQVLMACLTCCYFWHFEYPSRRNFRPLTNFILPVMGLCVLIEAYYAWRGLDAFTEIIIGTPYDLLGRLQLGDFNLLKMPVRILFPKTGRDAFMGAAIMNVFILIALGSLVKWKLFFRHKVNQDQFLITLLIVTFVQVLSAIPIAITIGILRYWFVQRIFLHLILGHTLLAVLGGYIFIRWLGRSIYRITPKIILGNHDTSQINGILEIGLILVLCVLSFQWYARYWETDQLEEESCSLAEDGKLPESFQGKSAVIEGPLGYDLMLKNLSLASEIEGPMNFIIKVSQFIKSCIPKSPEPDKRLFLWRNKQKEWYLTDQIPSQGEPLVQCQRPVSFSIHSL